MLIVHVLGTACLFWTLLVCLIKMNLFIKNDCLYVLIKIGTDTFTITHHLNKNISYDQPGKFEKFENIFIVINMNTAKNPMTNKPKMIQITKNNFPAFLLPCRN